jgi:hypothetical protein
VDRQQACSTCIGGHLTVPYEQNTQQSPDLGRSSIRHDGHSKKTMHAFAGISSSVRFPQSGQVITDRVMTFTAELPDEDLGRIGERT